MIQRVFAPTFFWFFCPLTKTPLEVTLKYKVPRSLIVYHPHKQLRKGKRQPHITRKKDINRSRNIKFSIVSSGSRCEGMVETQMKTDN